MTGRRRRYSGKSGYDADLDKVLWRAIVHEGRDAISIEIRQYDTHTPKLWIGRPEVQYDKLGRLSLVELTALVPKLDEAQAMLSRLAAEVEDEDEATPTPAQPSAPASAPADATAPQTPKPPKRSPYGRIGRGKK